VMLNRDKSVWHSNEHTPCYTQKVRNKRLLSLQAANMLQDRISAGDVKCPLGERQGCIWFDPPVADLRKGGNKVIPVAEADRGDALRRGYRRSIRLAPSPITSDTPTSRIRSLSVGRTTERKSL
jgi:hypothetical protein